MKYALCLFATVLACSMSKAAGPSLNYSASDIPALKKKVQSERFNKIWRAYLEQADDYCDPKSPDYADPERADQDLEQYSYDVRGHYSGRRLTKYMQALGLAYHLTGEKKYRDLGVKLLVAYAETIPVTHPYHVKGFAGGKGDFMRGLAMGYDQFGTDLTPEQKKIVLEAARGYVEDFLTEFENPKTGWYPYHNFIGVCGGAVGCLSLQLADLDPKASKDYVNRTAASIKTWLSHGFDKQGAYYEGIEYSTYGLEDATIFADALKRAGGEDLFRHPSLRKVMNYYVQSMLPGEKVGDARNDSEYCEIGDILLKYASEYKDGRAKFFYVPRKDKDPIYFQLVWDNDVPPVSPEKFGTPLFEYFEGRGLSVWRTGWKKDDVMFSIECGPYYPITHNQADKGQITLYGYGYRWVCDSGYGCNREPEGRCQTIAHNCILVDGKGQSISGAGIGNNGKTLKSENNDVYGYSLTDAVEAYRENIDRNGTIEDPVVRHPNMKMDRAYRHTIFLRPSHGAPAYAIVLDNISQDGNEHEYTWQILSWPNLDIQVTGENAAIVTPSSEAEKEIGPGKMFVFLDAETKPVLSNSFYDAGDGRPPGKPLPRLQAVCKAVNPYFASVLIPTSGAFKPEVKFERTAEETIIHVTWPGRKDTIVWNKSSLKKPGITVAKR